MRRLTLGILAPFCALSVTAAYGAVHYVDASALNDAGKGSQASPKKFLASGMALMSGNGGDTLVLAAGIYSDSKNGIARNTVVPSGKPGAYNVIKAAVDGSVLLTAALDLPLNAAYLQFEGLKWDSPLAKGIAGHHLKFLRCAFRGGPAAGNTVSLAIGTNDKTPGAQYVLIEDSWVYGPGGRYKLLVYNAEFVVLRRVVVRHDGGWSHDGRNPQGGITIYNSKDVQLQNAAVIDSDLAYSGWEAGIYLVKNTDSKTLPIHTGTRVRGSIVLNISGRAVGIEGWGRVQDARFEDTVIWKAGDGLSLNNGTHAVAARGLTVGNVSGTAFAIWGGSETTLDVRNSIVFNSRFAFQQQAGGVTHSHNNCSKTGTCSSAGETSYDPISNGLKYLPRIEAGTPLKSAGEGRQQVGAEIVNRIGQSGSLFGEVGFENVGSDSLWPWPYEGRLKVDLCEGGIARGMCGTSLSLTDYVWSRLGSASPVARPIAAPEIKRP